MFESRRANRFTIAKGLRLSTLEDLTPSASVRGDLPNCPVTVVNVHWHGSAALELTHKTRLEGLLVQPR